MVEGLLPRRGAHIGYHVELFSVEAYRGPDAGEDDYEEHCCGGTLDGRCPALGLAESCLQWMSSGETMPLTLSLTKPPLLGPKCPST